MYKIIKEAHSGLAYLVLLGLLFSTIFYFVLAGSKKRLTMKSKTVALITMILVHLQFVVGLILFFLSPLVRQALKDFGQAMKSDIIRLYSLEHPIIMLIVVVLVTIAHRKIKTSAIALQQLSFTGPILFLIATLFALSRIPWSAWLG